MGGCSIGLDDYWSSVTGIAGAATIEGPSFGVAFSAPSYNEEQSVKTASFALPLGQGSVLAHYTRYGSATYSENRISSGYAMRVSPNLMLGVTADYLFSNTADSYYPPIRHLTCSGALLYSRPNVFSIGAKVFNPMFVKMGTLSETRIPVIFSLGTSVWISSQLLVAAEIEKNVYLQHTPRLGVEYRFSEGFRARAGYSANPMAWYFGLGYEHARYCIDIAFQLHSVLGLTPSISGCYLTPKTQ